MKLFFISDIHGSEANLKWALDKLQSSKADFLIILGDQLYHGPRNALPEDYNPSEVAKMLNVYKDKIIAVRGNCEAEVDQMLLSYPTLNDYSIILLDGRRFFLSHGHIFNPSNLPNLSKGDIFCYGHTHIPELIEKNNIYIFNPGSISIPKGMYKKSYGIYEKNTLFIFDYEDKPIFKLELK